MNFYQLYNLLNEYGQSLIQTLIEKFKQEEPALTPTIIRNYIDRFDRIKNNLPEKDITKYSWKDLENAVDGYQPKQRIKAGTLDATVTDANLLYNQNKVRIYLGKDKKSCIKYGNGYRFCISARGEENMYGYYRIAKKGTPYFIFNDSLPKENPNHVLVLFVYDIAENFKEKSRYKITNALNNNDKPYSSIQSIISDYPWIKPITNFVDDENKGTVDIEPIEDIEYRLENEWEVFSHWLDTPLINIREFSSLSNELPYLFKESTTQEIRDFLNNDSEIVLVSIFIPSGRRDDTFNKRRTFFAFYKNAGDVLKQIKAKALDDDDFKYKKSDSELQQKIAKALKFKFKTVEGYLNSRDIISYGDGEAANVEFQVEGKESDYFLAKIVNISQFVRTDKNIKQIEKLFKFKIKQNKILNWLKVQSKETLQKILHWYDSYDSSRPEQLMRHAGIDSMTEFVTRFMEMYP
jgi:hypothetical protein